LSRLISQASNYPQTEFDTRIASLNDAANIEEAFLLYHYGIDNYTGSTNPSVNSLHSHLKSLKEEISALESEVENLKDTTDFGLVTIVTKESSHTLQSSDINKVIEMDSESENFLTIPPYSEVAFPIGTNIDIIQIGDGKTVLVEGEGVTLNSKGGNKELSERYSAVTIYKKSNNVWFAIGDLS